MRGLLFGNIDYRRHMSDEGNQFQIGLKATGWDLVGVGYGDGCCDVPTLLDRHNPTHVVVHDKRDWDPVSRISFRKDVGFTRLTDIAERDVWRAVVIKDAASFKGYQREFAEETKADALIIYYHPDAVDQHSGWTEPYKKIRTYHSVDADLCKEILQRDKRRNRAILTGVIGACYPLRRHAYQNARDWGVQKHRHPRYKNRGSKTPDYLQILARHKVHIATASKYGFALRKIIESVAMGCTPVTNLPEFDVLPHIDDALVRVPPGTLVQDVKGIIDEAVDAWNYDERMEWARIAQDWYDFNVVGQRLARRLGAASRKGEYGQVG